MPDLFRFLFDNPILLILLVSWLVSSLGGAMQRAARKAAEQQRRAGGGGSEAPRPAAARPTVVRAGRPRPARSEAEDIAREIRRAMGLEDAAAPRSAEVPPERPAAARATPPAVPGSAVRRAAAPPPHSREQVLADSNEGPRRGSLVDELREKAAHRVDISALRRRTSAAAGAAIRSRHLSKLRPHIGGGPAAGATAAAQVGVRPLIDLHRPAAAIIALEILGPPVGLRREGYAAWQR
ncbi:MAG: hypothetical protein IPM29_12640 [Planctomycetes bacterium]|nr:hypothetical protein [Planctomycetota bacterium]